MHKYPRFLSNSRLNMVLYEQKGRLEVWGTDNTSAIQKQPDASHNVIRCPKFRQWYPQERLWILLMTLVASGPQEGAEKTER